MAISDRIAIMDRGRIAQIGTAEELYQRPASRFVAGFLGTANMLRATVAEAAAGGLVLDLAGQRWTLATDQRFAPGQAVDVVLRPETLGFAPDGAGLAGVVESRVYLGAKAEYMIRCGEQALHVVQTNPLSGRRHAVGERVTLALPPAGVQLLEASAHAG